MTGSNGLEGDETRPLLHDVNVHTEAKKVRTSSISVLSRLLFCGFLISASFGMTQVALLLIVRTMTCDAYYEDPTHIPPGGDVDRCAVHAIEAQTASSVALLGSTTTVFGILNLLFTTWSIKRFGIKQSLMLQAFWPAMRVGIQSIGVMKGSNAGVLIIQCSQIITIIGGPSGYFLALNAFVAEMVEAEERTGAMGRIQGAAMVGVAVEFLAGGLISDYFGLLAPFEVTTGLFFLATIYVMLALPTVSIAAEANEVVKPQTPSMGLARFFGPLRVFVPQQWRLPNGAMKRQYGALILAFGVFLGTLATGYIPTLIQLYSTDVLGFGATQNSILISTNALVAGLFLNLVFPRLIKIGRAHTKSRDNKSAQSVDSSTILTAEDQVEAATIKNPSIAPQEFTGQEPTGSGMEPTEPVKLTPQEPETFAFDLEFTRWSLLADGVLTGTATFVRHDWQIYLVAIILPLASGTGAAARGTILQMCPASARADALSAITLVDMTARLATMSLFGVLFGVFANMGKLYLIFVCNATVALVGFVVLLLARFPPDGSSRISTEEANNNYNNEL